jgi:predicted transposase/invertase (TIGR01784 family)
MPKKRNILSFDYAIKRQLRDKANYDIVSGFLSELFGHDVSITSIDESESTPKNADGKTNRIDIVASEGKGTTVLIELQFEREFDFFQRMLFGASRAISERLGKGEDYDKVQKVYSVNIMYMELGSGIDYIYHGTTDFEGMHEHDELQLSEEQKKEFQGKKLPRDIFPEYYILNLSKFSGQVKDTLDEWILYLQKDEVQETIKAKGLAKAKAVLDYDKLTPEERNKYDHEVEARRSLKSALYTAEREGFYEGEAKGRTEGAREAKLATARKLKAKGMTAQEIADLVELGVEEVAQA